MIDSALLRPGRIDRIIYVPLPDFDTRTEILKIHLRATPVGDDVDTSVIVRCSEGFSGAEISALCREAALAALKEDINCQCVMSRHFDEAFLTVQPRISSEMMQYYAKFHDESGLHCI